MLLDDYDTWLAHPALGINPESFVPAATTAPTAPASSPATAPATVPTATPTTIDAAADVGSLSAHWESGSRGSNAVGNDSTGGWSYGKFQIATKTGTMQKFLDYLQTANPDAYKTLNDAGGAKGATDHTEGFAKAWQDLATAGTIATAEHGFIEQTHYTPQSGKLEGAGVDLDTRSKALKDVVWSTAVQLGPDSGAITTALQTLVDERKKQEAKARKPDDKSAPRTDAEIAATIPDDELIKAVYAERGKTATADGKTYLVHFKNSTQDVQDAVAKRFKDECAAALKELADSQPPAPAATPTPAPALAASSPATTASDSTPVEPGRLPPLP